LHEFLRVGVVVFALDNQDPQRPSWLDPEHDPANGPADGQLHRQAAFPVTAGSDDRGAAICGQPPVPCQVGLGIYLDIEKI
jgi:hypothetical protein